MTAQQLHILHTLFLAGVFFLPTLVAIVSGHRYITVGFYNVLIGWAMIASSWSVLGWFLLLWLVLPRHRFRFAMIGRRTA